MSNFRRRLLLTNQTNKELYLYGNSVQDGIPAPETPIDIMSLENPIIKTTGNNLFKPTIEGEIVSAGITIRLNDDNSITLNGGPATSGGYKTIGVLMMQANKIYTMSGAIGGSWENSYQLYTYYYKNEAEPNKFAGAVQNSNIRMYPEKNQQVNIKLVFAAGATFDNLTLYPMINEGNSLPHEPYKEEIITINETTPLGNNVLPYPYYDSDKQNENMSFNSSENDNGQIIINGKSDVTELYYCTKPDENNEGLLNHIFQDKETYSISEVPIGYKIIEKTKPKNTKVDVSGLWELISTNEDGAKNYFYTSYDNIKYKLGPIGGIGAHRTHDGCYNAELLKSTGVKQFIPNNKNSNSLSFLLAAGRFIAGAEYTACLQKIGIQYTDGSYDKKYAIVTASLAGISLANNGNYDYDRISRFMMYTPKKDANGVELDLTSYTILSANCQVLTQATDIGLNRNLTLDDIEFSGECEVIKGTSTPLTEMVYGSNYEANRAYPVNSCGYVNSITLNFDKEVDYIDYNIDNNRFDFNETVKSANGNVCYVKVNIPGANDEYAYYARFSKHTRYNVALLGATYNVNGNWDYASIDYNRDLFATYAEALEYGVFENKINSADYVFPNKDLEGNLLDTENPWFGRKGFMYILKSPSDTLKRPYIFLIDSIDGPSQLTARAYSIPPIYYSLRYIDKSTGNEYYYRNTRFTIDKSKYLYCDFRIETISDYTISNKLVSPMIQKGIVVGEFEKYKAPITVLRGVGNYRDKIYTKDGKVYYEQMIGVFENDSSDEFGMATSPTTYYYFQKPRNALPASLSQTLQRNNPGLCNYFKYNPQLSEANSNFIWTQNTAIRSAFKITNIENVENWVADKTISTIYPIIKQEPIEITGPLAEQILNIDKDKNITIYSDNGIYGNIELIEQ